MGCDIHTYVEQQEVGGDWIRVPWPDPREFQSGPFDDRHYGLFGFLADVRNSSEVPTLAEPRGLPADVSASVRAEFARWGDDGHTHSWLAADELLTFDYDQSFEDRRVTRQVAPNLWHGACTAEPGDGQIVTYREFLGVHFFDDLAGLNTLNKMRPTRVVFWFDN